MTTTTTTMTVPETVTVTEAYKCDACGAAGLKLWRQAYGARDQHGHSLKCAGCLVPDGRVDDDGRYKDKFGHRTDQVMGWLPAVPTGNTFWGYTSVPDDAVMWWKMLPTYHVNEFEAKATRAKLRARSGHLHLDQCYGSSELMCVEMHVHDDGCSGRPLYCRRGEDLTISKLLDVIEEYEKQRDFWKSQAASQEVELTNRVLDGIRERNALTAARKLIEALDNEDTVRRVVDASKDPPERRVKAIIEAKNASIAARLAFTEALRNAQV